jgi:hypothetical protein
VGVEGSLYTEWRLRQFLQNRTEPLPERCACSTATSGQPLAKRRRMT